MRWVLVYVILFSSIVVKAQIIYDVCEVVLEHKHKRWHIRMDESSYYKLDRYKFKNRDEDIDARGFRSQVILHNLGKLRLRDSGRAELQNRITEVLKNYEANLLFSSEDYRISTYKIEQESYDPTYLEVRILAHKKFRVVITLIEDPDRYHMRKGAILEPVVKSKFLNNPSFEDTARLGRTDKKVDLAGWYDCGTEKFPGTTPPDIHSRESHFWDCMYPPSNGETYLGLVTRSDESWESISQELTSEMQNGKCYEFSIDVRMDRGYSSPTKENLTQLSSFAKPIVLKVYLGDELCSHSKLFFQSQPIFNNAWNTVSLAFECEDNYDHLTIEAYYDRGESPYNGNILVDKAVLKEIENCNE